MLGEYELRMVEKLASDIRSKAWREWEKSSPFNADGRAYWRQQETLADTLDELVKRTRALAISAQ